MSSWIPSLFNPFTDDENNLNPPEYSSPPKSPAAGARDDLSAVFRGVAAFLAPPPAAAGAASSSETIDGIKSDLAEIQGTFRSGLSLISSKITSNLLQLQNQISDGDGNDGVEEEGEEEDDDEEDGLGISEEILEFVLKISRRPELWTDFPLSMPDNDFQLSNYQREHAENIDHLVPDFEMLRQNLCNQMSKEKFWLIYFILLLPRLNEEDLKLLSTPQVAEARETLLKQLQSKNAQETSGNPDSSDAKYASSETVNPTQPRETVDEPEPEPEPEPESVSGHQPEAVEPGPSADAHKQSPNEEDVSFSDLEDEENDDPSDKLSACRQSTSEKAWVQLDENSGSQGSKQNASHNVSKDKESEGEDSNDWLTVDDTDFDNLGAV
ncbi:FH1/FH2 domain-containing protein 3-like [Salvia splendens]|uniref:FH1/FH2 domain-containing protein 3-like n=1 Tax=Salvia splendens TaxID=180675 RepID=UPI001C25F5A4|nr:FH1/FH2 domain-containing protein 3-like [Salvia splendens]